MKYVMIICVAWLFISNAYAENNGKIQKEEDMIWQGRSFIDEGYRYVYGFDGKVVVEKREKDFIVQRMECPELPNNIPEIKNVIDLANLVIEKYTTTPFKTPVIAIPVTEEWEQMEKKFKRKYDKSDGTYDFMLKMAYKTREDQFPSIFFADGFFNNYPVLQGKTLLLPGLRILLDEEGKVKYVFCFYPPLNEDFVYILRRTEIGWQFLSFSLEDKEPKSGPYILWDNEGKIIEQGERILYLKDFDMPVDSDKIELRDSTPHEFWIPSKSANLSVGH